MESKQHLEALESAGLSEKEAMAYLDLLQYGESQTGKICERTGIPSSRIYRILDTLLKKGLVNYKIINNIKVFRASEPDSLAHLFEEKEKEVREEKKELLDFISKLKVRPSEIERLSDYKYFEGLRGIKSLYTEVINSWKKDDEYYVVAATTRAFEKLDAFFMEVVHKKRVKDKVNMKMIINEKSKKWGPKRARMKYTEIRYLDIDTNTEYGVLNDYFFLVTYEKEPYGLLIKDKNFADTYRVFFDILWKSAKR